MIYRCPRCGATMVCVSTASIPPIISYQCYGCGYFSKPIRETELTEVRERLVVAVKAAACDLFDRAEDLVGNGNLMTDFDIWIRFPQGYDTAPTIEVTKRYVSEKSNKVLLDDDYYICLGTLLNNLDEGKNEEKI